MQCRCFNVKVNKISLTHTHTQCCKVHVWVGKIMITGSMDRSAQRLELKAIEAVWDHRQRM